MIAICHNYDAIIPLSPRPQLAKGAAELVPGLHIRSPYTFQSISTTVVQSTWLSCLTLLQRPKNLKFDSYVNQKEKFPAPHTHSQSCWQ